jgi:tight adherence protein C
MFENYTDMICYFVSVFTLLLAIPYSKQLFFRVLSDYIVLANVKKASFSKSKLDEIEDSESIGLSQKGPMFSNKLFNRIAQLNNGQIVIDMRDLLQKAGMRQNDALEMFMRQKVTTSIICMVIITILIETYELSFPIWASIPLSFILGVLCGHKLTNLALESKANKRKEAIDNGVPDLIDLLVICSESGVDLNRSVRRIAREMRTSNFTLADELSLTSIELEMIPDQRVVFQNFGNRTDSVQIKTLAKTLSQSIEYGASLAVTLRDLAIESRQKRMLEAEAKAAQAPALLTVPMMLFILPCLFIVMLGPVIVDVIEQFSATP